MSYFDGFVIAVPKANRQAFLDHADKNDRAFIQHGALRVIECWEDDVPDGQVTDFRRAVKATADEAVVFAWIEWPDKATRDKAFAEIMKDPAFAPANNPMPFDGKRMIFGGFTPVVDVSK